MSLRGAEKSSKTSVVERPKVRMGSEVSGTVYDGRGIGRYVGAGGGLRKRVHRDRASCS